MLQHDSLRFIPEGQFPVVWAAPRRLTVAQLQWPALKCTAGGYAPHLDLDVWMIWGPTLAGEPPAVSCAPFAGRELKDRQEIFGHCLKCKGVFRWSGECTRAPRCPHCGFRASVQQQNSFETELYGNPPIVAGEPEYGDLYTAGCIRCKRGFRWYGNFSACGPGAHGAATKLPTRTLNASGPGRPLTRGQRDR